MPHPHRRLTRGLTGLMLMVLALGTATELRAEVPPVVQQIPEEAQAFIAVPSLSGLSEDLEQFNQQSGIEHPRLNDVLGQIKSMGNLHKGLNDDGGAAFVLLSAPLPEPGQQGQRGRQGPPEGVLLLPVSDYSAFLENFGIQDATEDAPTRIELQGRPAFVKRAGDYAVLSNLHGITESFELAEETGLLEQVGSFGREAMEESGLLFYADMADLGPRLRPMLDMGLMRVRQKLKQQGGNGGNADQMAAQEAFLDLQAGAMRALLRDTQASVIGFDLSEDGVGLTGTAQFKPDSPLGQSLSEAPEDPVSFDRLPDRSYMLASSVNVDALPLQRWFRAAVDTLPEDHPFAPVFRSSLGMLDQLEGEAQQAWYLPEGGAGGPGNLFHGVSVYETGDPAALRETYQQILDELDGVKLGPESGYTTEYEEDVMEVAGQQVDRYKLQFDLSPEQREQLGPMVALLGQGVSGYLVTTDDTMIVTNGGDPSLIKAAVEAAQNGEGLEQNLGIGESRTGLPEDRVAEVYLDVGSVMRMARSLVALFAPEMQIEVPEDLPPSAGSLSVRDSGMAARMYVPMKVVSALTDALRELQGDNGGDDSVSRKEDGSPSGRSKALLSFSGAQFERRGVKASRNQPVVVGMWAPWSEPSKKQVEILDTLAERYEGRARLGTVNIDEHPKLGQRYELDAVPTILIFKDGKVTRRMTGVTSARKLSEHIDAVLAE